MMVIRTVSVSPLKWSNQLSRYFFPAPPFLGERYFRLLQFQQMDSFGSSSISHVLPDATFYGSSVGGDEGYLINGDNNSDVIMVGSIAVCLKRWGLEQNLSLSSSVRKCDTFESGRVREAPPADVPNPDCEDEFPALSKHGNRRRSRIDFGFEDNGGRSRSNNTSSSQLGSFPMLNNTSQRDEPSLPNRFGKNNNSRQFGDFCAKNSLVAKNLPPFQPFNICQFERRGKAKSEASWHVKARATEEIMDHVAEATNNRVLRPGMVLLKHYMTLREQVNIVKTCQKLGLGPGGFYRPGYKGGAKLRLQMMCLGLNWDPQTRKYEDKRAVDGDKAPDIPPEFATLVEKSLKDAHAMIMNESNTSNVEGILPSMSPDICIVNFYTTSGKLGLHQDRDESKQSLIRGLPVVSFSVGDSAEFLYGDQRDADKAEKVVLESGDVLIFGGESRHIYHGVSSIIPNSAPKFLLDHTGLRPGRLNLTFRKH